MDIFVLVTLCLGLLFACMMKYKRTSLWTGFLFLLLCGCLALTGLIEYMDSGNWYLHHPILNFLIFFFASIAAIFILLFPLITLITFFIQGIKNLRKEGIRFSNALSLFLSFVIFITLFLFPIVGIRKILLLLHIHSSFTVIFFVFLNVVALYFLGLLCVYVITGYLNTFHISEKQNFQYIIVLGCQVFGKKVPPLLAGRIEKGIELYHKNPDAILIMSGGQGNGEDIAEAEAMKQYAIEHGVDENRILVEDQSTDTRENLLNSLALMQEGTGSIAIVTNAFHVFRALLIANTLHIHARGYGSKTKWYFSLNAMIREFVGYLSMKWKLHTIVSVLLLLLILLVNLV